MRIRNKLHMYAKHWTLCMRIYQRIHAPALASCKAWRRYLSVRSACRYDTPAQHVHNTKNGSPWNINIEDRRAWRRPVTDPELRNLWDIYTGVPTLSTNGRSTTVLQWYGQHTEPSRCTHMVHHPFIRGVYSPRLKYTWNAPVHRMIRKYMVGLD